MRPRAVSLACLLLAALAGGGCGDGKTPPPDVATPGPTLGTTPQSFPAAGLRFASPAGWTVTPGKAPLVAAIRTGTAIVAVWRYPRTEPLPTSARDLKAARDALVAAAKARDPSFVAVRSGTVRIDGHRGVQVRGSESVLGQPRTVRSTHVFVDGAEIVVDAFARDEDFRRVDAQAFRPLLRSLRITKARS